MMHNDSRFRKHPTYPFAVYRKAETQLHKNNIQIHMKKGQKMNGEKVMAKDILGNDIGKPPRPLDPPALYEFRVNSDSGHQNIRKSPAPKKSKSNFPNQISCQ